MLENKRFVGSWLLESFESESSGGVVTRPWGDAPIGIINWDASGYFSVQLGPKAPGGEGYTAFFGTASGDDGEAGVITLRVQAGTAPERVNGDQVRNFTFLEPGLLRMRPPKGLDGAQSTFMWRRAAG